MKLSDINLKNAVEDFRRLNPALFGGSPQVIGPQPQRETEAIAAAIDGATKPRRAKEPNKTEREYERILRAMFPRAIIRWEAYTLRLAVRCSYSPDFSVEHEDGTLEFVEVKGAYVFPKALVKLRLAAQEFSHKFTLAQKIKGEWIITEMQRKTP